MAEALVFIVRLWAIEPQAAFRAAVLRAGSDESAWFTRADALANFLEQQARAADGSGRRDDRKEQS
jgi:hypothetical protein